MVIINLIKKVNHLIVTPITNINFTSNEVVDNTLLDELEVEPKTRLSVFNSKKQRKEEIYYKDIKDYHWILDNNSLLKIMHVID